MRKFSAYALFGVVGWLATAPLAYGEWPVQSCAMPHRIPVTLSTGNQPHSAEIRIDLTSSDFPVDYVFSSNGDDIRIFRDDDITPVDFFVTSWDSVARAATIYVNLGTIPANSNRTIRIYLGDNSLPAAGDVALVFPDVGLRLHSRASTADPTSPANALAAFAAATSNVYNAVRTSLSGLNNQALGGSNSNYGWCISGLVEVTPAEAGLWSFRYGADFGRGGHLYISGVQLEEQWNDNLWWANNYANTAETLEGNITLAPGWHRYEALGFEDCCDGATGFQARRPGGLWQDLNTTNFSMRASQCVNTTVSVSVGAPQSCSTSLNASKSVSIAPSSSSPYAVPGAIIEYTLEIENPGQSVDAGTLVLTDIFPANISLMTTAPGAFMLSDGTPSSGLSLSYAGPGSTTDGVEFSVDGLDFSYTPATPVDPNVTHVRFRPTGTFAPNNAGARPNFTITLFGQVQ